MLPGGRKQRGKAIEAVQHIRGGLLRGAVADAWLLDADSNKTDDDFNTLFLSEDAGIFRNCSPGTHVLPATAVSCKNFSRFLSKQMTITRIHTVSLTRLSNDSSRKRQIGYIIPCCPYCEKGRVESQSGFYTQIQWRVRGKKG